MPNQNRRSLDDIFSSQEVSEPQAGKSLDDIFTQEKAQPATFDDFMSAAVPISIGVGGLGLAGVGINQFAKPFVQSSKLSREAQPLRESIGVGKKTSVLDLPELVSQKQKDFDIRAKGIADDMAVNLKKNMQSWKNSAYSMWENEISSINNELSSKKLNFSTKNFNDMLSRTSAYLEAQGDDKGAEAIRKAMVKTNKSGSLSNMLDFDDASKRVSLASGKVPSVRNVLKENWLEFLSKDPVMKQVPMTAEKIGKLYDNYTPFKNVVNTLESLSPQKFGEFKTKQLSSILQNAIKGESNDAVRVLEYLSKGSDTIPAMEGASDVLANLSGLTKSKAKFNEFLSKANQMAMNQSNINKAINRRFLGMNVAGMGRLAGAGRMLGGGLYGVGVGALDPSRAMGDPVEIINRMISGGEATEEEKVKFFKNLET